MYSGDGTDGLPANAHRDGMYELDAVPDADQVWCVAAVVLDAQGRAFLQRRGPQRSLFPGCWDLVAGQPAADEHDQDDADLADRRHDTGRCEP